MESKIETAENPNYDPLQPISINQGLKIKIYPCKARLKVSNLREIKSFVLKNWLRNFCTEIRQKDKKLVYKGVVKFPTKMSATHRTLYVTIFESDFRLR